MNSGGYLPRRSGSVNIHRYSPPLRRIIVNYHRLSSTLNMFKVFMRVDESFSVSRARLNTGNSTKTKYFFVAPFFLVSSWSTHTKPDLSCDTCSQMLSRIIEELLSKTGTFNGPLHRCKQKFFWFETRTFPGFLCSAGFKLRIFQYNFKPCGSNELNFFQDLSGI